MPASLYAVARTRSDYSPRKTDGSDPKALADDMAVPPALRKAKNWEFSMNPRLVWIEPSYKKYIMGLDELRQRVTLTAIRTFKDGGIYAVAPLKGSSKGETPLR